MSVSVAGSVEGRDLGSTAAEIKKAIAEVQKDLPPINSDVLTQNGRHRVLAHEILAGQLLVETEDHRRILIPDN